MVHTRPALLDKVKFAASACRLTDRRGLPSGTPFARATGGPKTELVVNLLACRTNSIAWEFCHRH